ncbi:MAG: autotransporter domain-containing protein [Alphaproteobacteria bacterium]|nr:autotransporter domain-containing protein [Alphaproteobacteria bacterium]
MFKCMKINNKVKTFVLAIFVGTICGISSAKASISVARAFYELARQNNTQKIESLVYRGYSLESVDEDGYNPVCLSVLRRDKSAYKVLVSYGAKKRPECLEKIPESEYRRFFGVNPIKQSPAVYRSDTPYNTSAVLLGTGAVAAAFVLKGATDGSGGGSGSSGGGKEEETDEENKNNETRCPPNSTYKPREKKCVCNDGYDNFGNSKSCYAKIENCSNQSLGVCKNCKDGYVVYNNECVLISECPANGYFDPASKSCLCNYGYGHYGDARACYETIDNCANQKKDTCSLCQNNYILSDNKCYAKIAQCKVQDKDICKECNLGFGIHGGNQKACYKDIENCSIQLEDKCTQCINGYGTHGDPFACYKNVDFCIAYNPANREKCTECQSGYITHGDGICYVEDYCKSYPNTVPLNGECKCDASRGYVGEPGNCKQVEDGEYAEGDGNRDQWDNVNERYCHSHGVYQEKTGVCECYIGYAGSDCSICDQRVDAQGDNLYIPFDGRCYKNIKCSQEEHKVQKYDFCVCEKGYIMADGFCIEELTCPLGMEQYIGEDLESNCQCKTNFIPSPEGEGCICPSVENGYLDSEYTYDMATDSCIKIVFDCTEKNKRGDKWSGENCDVCESKYAITEDETGKRCGLACAKNRAPIKENQDCSLCAENFDFNDVAGTCVRTECEDGVDGYIKVNGNCECDEENGYAMTTLGMCEKKLDPLIGLKVSNINNNSIILTNDGQHRDIYGMKPVLGVEEDGRDIYYESVYNSLNHPYSLIDIKNNNTGYTKIYGIYSTSDIYNSAGISATDNIDAKGTIIIADSNSQSVITAIKSNGAKNVYNSFAYNANPENSLVSSTANINISKHNTSNGEVIGIDGYNNIYNSYAATKSGVGANVEATSTINIKHQGIGTVIGINNTSGAGRVNNSFAYLDSAVSDAIAKSTINVEGNSGVYGIIGKSIIVNSETQFNKNYNIVNNFKAVGEINVTGHSGARGEAAYGIYAMSNTLNKSEIYNAMGYNAKGTIKVKNVSGGSAYGIYSETEKYVERDELGNVSLDEEGNPVYIYNNVYNAFRSSQVYGGENAAAEGTIALELSGSNDSQHQAIGIFANGDVFNSYARSGGDVMLETIGKIEISDTSGSGNMYIKGIEAGGDTVANAYGIGINENTSTNVAGVIKVNKTGLASSTNIAGIYHNIPNYSKGVKIYNAALINDKSTVMGSIDITVKNRPYNIYGMYVDRGAEDGQIKTIYNAYYENNEEIKDGMVVGNIKISSTSAGNETANSYGIYAKDSVVYNAYSTNPDATVIGNITIESKGGMLGGEVVGIYGSGVNSKLYNSGKNSTIKVESTGNGWMGKADAYGMKGISSTMRNEGSIYSAIIEKDNIESQAYGMYVEDGAATNDTSGKITVSGFNKNYGIYAKSSIDSAVTSYVYNNGTINVSGGKENYGIYADITPGSIGLINVENNGTINITGNGAGIYASGEGVTITNTGTINITTQGESPSKTTCTGDNCNNNSAIVLNGATYLNQGALTSSSTIDLDSYNGNIVLAKGGSFVAPDKISGNLNVSTSVVADTFDKTTTLNNALSSNDVNELNVNSESYMYNANLELNKDKNYDITLALKDFKDITSNDLARYYELNYENSNNSELFNILKGAKTQNEFNKRENEITGKYVLPNIVEEELKMARGLDNNLVSELFKQQEGVRRIVGGNASKFGRDTTTSLTGYELDSQAMYAIYDKNINNNYRLGLGVSFTQANTDYDNASSRKKLSIQGYLPLTYNLTNKITGVSMARFGYEDGEYTRYGYDSASFDANLNAISYGLLNELRYDLDLGAVKLTPFIGLNAIGWYYNTAKEQGGSNSLNILSSHVMSIESALGVYLDKDVKFNEHSNLKMSLGLGYYHEFADPYNSMKARLNNSNGSYKLKNSIAQRDRGVISAKINYDYKQFSIYSELMQYLEDEYPIKLDLGLKYNF